MNNSLTWTNSITWDTVLVTEVLAYGGGEWEDMVQVVTSRGDVVWAFFDELTIWTL